MRKSIVAVLAVGALCALAATALAAKSVKVGDNYFVRAAGTPKVTVSKGTTVRWRFAGDSLHNVTVSRGPVKFRSPTRISGSYSKKMRRRGTYTIYCTVHGASDQRMKLVVK
jgi:plastocyanin